MKATDITYFSTMLTAISRFLNLYVVMCLLVTLVNAGANTKIDRKWKQKKVACQRNECYQLIPEESANCLNQCVSKACYDEIYGSSPLEDGEIDDIRSRLFTSCLRKEQKEIIRKTNMRNPGSVNVKSTGVSEEETTESKDGEESGETEDGEDEDQQH